LRRASTTLERPSNQLTPTANAAHEVEPPSSADRLDDKTLELIARRRAPDSHRRGWLVRRALATADAVGLLLAFGLAQLVVGSDGAAADQISASAEFALFALTIPLWLMLLRAYGLYDRDEERTDHTTADDVFGVFNAVTVGAWAFYAGTWVTGIAGPTFLKVLTFWAGAVVLVSAARVCARAICRRRQEYLQNTVVVGAGGVGQMIARKLIQHPEYGVNLVGFVDARPKERREEIGNLSIVGSADELSTLVEELQLDRIIVAFSDLTIRQNIELVRELGDLDVQVDIVPRLYEIVGPHVSVHTVEGLPLLAVPRAKLSRSSLAIKRLLDVTLAIVGLVLLAPLLAAIVVAIRVDTPGPVLFRQIRMGRGGRVFRIVKFRTMSLDADARKQEVAHLNKHLRLGGDPRMFKVVDDPRVTRVGRVLRRYSLDELPQLWNVLKGEMSIVGPRPLILEEDEWVDGWGRKRLDLKPGITGLWQVLGRDDIPFEEMVELDYRYVTAWSLLNDLKLIALTVPVLLRSRPSH
jgi:exopolysaccharide biosynthesis polyprenyl glycosylphosphotransferase